MVKEDTPKEPTQKVEKTGIVSEMLEQARQFYVAALAKQELNSTNETVANYESALKIINSLSYYPGIEENEAYVELEKSILDDYKKYVDGLSELPVNVSFAALEEWMGKTVSEHQVAQNGKEPEIPKDFKPVVIPAEIPLEINPIVEQWIEYQSRQGLYAGVAGKIGKILSDDNKDFSAGRNSKTAGVSCYGRKRIKSGCKVVGKCCWYVAVCESYWKDVWTAI